MLGLKLHQYLGLKLHQFLRDSCITNFPKLHQFQAQFGGVPFTSHITDSRKDQNTVCVLLGQNLEELDQHLTVLVHPRKNINWINSWCFAVCCCCYYHCYYYWYCYQYYYYYHSTTTITTTTTTTTTTNPNSNTKPYAPYAFARAGCDLTIHPSPEPPPLRE